MGLMMGALGGAEARGIGTTPLLQRTDALAKRLRSITLDGCKRGLASFSTARDRS